MKSIDSNFISVVIQGPLFRKGHHAEKGDLLRRAIASIREHLPHAEIIVSTWLTENIEGLTDIILVQSEEPTSFVDYNGELNNINRQLLSTNQGIAAATRPYVLKFRADHYLAGTEMMQIGESATSKFFFLSAPLTVTNFFIPNPLQFPMLFHMSDLIMFGKREDMLDFWHQPLVEESKLFMSERELPSVIGNFQSPTVMRHAPEQSLMLGWLAKHALFIHLPHRFYTTFALFILWEKILVDNFHVINGHESGVIFPTRLLQTAKMFYSERDIAVIKVTQGMFRQKCRYIKLWLNKYFFIWFTFRSIVVLFSHLFYYLSPNFEKKVREFYRTLRGVLWRIMTKNV